MSVATRLTGFAALLGLAFGGTALAGAAIDPTDEPPRTPARWRGWAEAGQESEDSAYAATAVGS